MDIIYKCACMPVEVTLSIMARPDGGDIVDWVENCLGASVAVDHRARSPRCRARAMEYVKIPVDDAAAGIGMLPRKH